MSNAPPPAYVAPPSKGGQSSSSAHGGNAYGGNPYGGPPPPQQHQAAYGGGYPSSSAPGASSAPPPPAYASPPPAGGAYAAPPPAGGAYGAPPTAQPVQASYASYPAGGAAGRYAASGATVPWSSDLCSCAEDMESCCMVLFCSTCMIRVNAARFEDREISFIDILAGIFMCGLNMFYGVGLPVTWYCVCQNRQHIKAGYGIGNHTTTMEGEDYCQSCCCTVCTICQHSREISAHSGSGVGPGAYGGAYNHNNNHNANHRNARHPNANHPNNNSAAIGQQGGRSERPSSTPGGVAPPPGRSDGGGRVGADGGECGGAAASKLKAPPNAVIYWERQQMAQCGIHCVNNLLQVALFEEEDFAKIALWLDAKELEIMGFAARRTPSQNVDSKGNYSVQVIVEALRRARMKALYLGELDAAEAAANPVGETGFVCHRPGHWFALRKIDDAWFNLDSLLRGPHMITDAFVAQFIAEQQANGYSVLVVRGEWPKPVSQQPPGAMIRSRGNWFDARAMTILSRSGFAEASLAGSSLPSSNTSVYAKGILIVKEAVRADKAGRNADAVDLYTNGLTYLMQALGRMQAESQRASALRIRISEYMARAEELKKKLKPQ
ncbi:uncharacterized protein AMSG_11855 [Thecamonas trahens ATCC 50062]|uniref:ubiquitinyl hydrolase 1 n=1 Tax=Thecamonas trahens ATCC 50062 TaxID=461836 RepID=A0A0L0DCX1_THETB|nr:hypothetical protein AMSG_11855 [Thecamonas trahens ATCC 50062]KNC49168.1 hypothetical protein AMSG_11855 [Thecamonas trahens ATCC 50062]|eukprot:XP_013758234.1 hypothetical protein AMSG_11855 [Thecamonas trahens ATCC 50062]